MDILSNLVGGDKVIDLVDFRWQSDWNGYEVGYDDIDVVGLYSMKKYPIDVYMDYETGNILEAWSFNEEVDNG